MLVKRLFALILALAFSLSFTVTAFADEYEQSTKLTMSYAELTTPKSGGALVNDMANLLTEDEEVQLTSRLKALSVKHRMDVAVVTAYTLNNKSPMEFADDYYDYNHYGQGTDNSGMVLLVSTEDNDWWLSTAGEAIKIFDSSTMDYIFDDNVVDYFSNEDWMYGFSTFADMCDDCLSAYENGEDYPPASFTDIAFTFGICIVIALVITLVVMSIIRSKYKNVAFKASANDYLVKDSLILTNSYDSFLYTNVIRTAKPKESSSSHSSSSGSSHGGGGGKF